MSGNKNKYVAAAVLAVCVVLFLFSGTAASDVKERSISKSNPGKGADTYDIQATVNGLEIDEIEIQVNERSYTEDECKALFGKCKEELIRTILADNDDLNYVTSDLRFVTELKGYPFFVEYDTDSPDKIGETGELTFDKPFTAVIVITCSYEDFKESYSVRIKANPDDNIKKRVYKRLLVQQIEESGEEGDYFVLPESVEGLKVSYKTGGKKREPAFLLLGLVAAAGVLLGTAKDEKRKAEEYRKAVLKEYPTVLRKISLYLASGMNLRNIWQAVYEEGIKKKGSDNPFYKEMGISINELSSGIAEGLAYTGFGERTKEPELIRFTALLSQNLKKGSSRLKELLNEEVTKAFMAKKQRAIKAGEEAGTKMLVPMVMLLIDVMIIIVIPAFRGI